MKTSVQTGIAVGVAIIVIGVFFVFPQFSPFTIASQNAGSASNAQQTGTTTTQQSTSSTATTTSMNTNQLEITDEKVGTGATAEPGDTVTVKYVGAFTDGKIFDASSMHAQTKNGFSFVLGAHQVIAGWDEGLVGMKVGGTRKLIVPPSLGYGSQDYHQIPGGSTLVFQVELLNVQKPTK